MTLPSILMVQERGRHPENWQFRESENLRRAFDRAGVRSEIWGLGQPTFSASFDEIVKDYDVVFVMENYDQQNWLPDLRSCPKFKVFWSIDSHCALGQHVWFSKQSRFQVHLNSTEGYLKHFQRHSPRALWFPNAYPDDLIAPRPDVDKIHPLGFCGSMIGGRDRWLGEISNTVPVRSDVFILGEEMVKAVNSYKIGLNKSIADDINYRVFETLGCRTMLLTNEVHGLDRLFTPGEHLVTYKDTGDLVEKARYYLLTAPPGALEAIAAAGHEHVREHHTYSVRAKKLLEIISEGI